MIFVKEIEVFEAVIDNSYRCNKSKEMKQFSTDSGTTLRLLEGSTLWANRTELCGGLFKETVCKTILDTDSLLVLWN